MRITKNGVNTYIFQGKLNDKSIRMAIGSAKMWVIDV
jgi:hypothetical protein